MEQIVFEQISASIEAKKRVNIEEVVEAARIIIDCLKEGGKLLIFGNGGSAADAQHLAAEFVGRFKLERKALGAIALTTDTSILTALGNDYGFDTIFSRQIEALGRAGDVAIGISTSGNSPNVLSAIKMAKKKRLKTIGLTGEDGGKLKNEVDLCLCAPTTDTAHIQEVHITVGHILCHLAEQALFGEGKI